MSTHANRVKMTVASVAADPYTITLDAASSGYRSFATAYGANATVDVLITMGTTWEIARNCTYTHSGTTLSRGTLESSSTGSRITTFDNTAVVSVIATAGFGNAVDNTLGAWGALNGENSITGTATAVIGRLNVCSGTSANYTVTLPAVSGNSGKYIGFRMVLGLTKLVTLDGDGTETIDGATTRVMWAGETALLYCDGSTWTKMAGKTIAMTCQMAKSTNVTVTKDAELKIDVNTTISDNSGTMADTSNFRIYARRAGIFQITTVIRANQLTANVERWTGLAHKNGNTGTYYAQSEASGLSGTFIFTFTSQPAVLAKDDYMELYSYYSGASAPATQSVFSDGTQQGSSITLLEIPQW